MLTAFQQEVYDIILKFREIYRKLEKENLKTYSRLLLKIPKMTDQEIKTDLEIQFLIIIYNNGEFNKIERKGLCTQNVDEIKQKKIERLGVKDIYA
jgi:hypothetical protein